MNEVIGLKLKRLRSQKGFTQEQVAEHLHISQSAYARIENGESNSWANHLEAISHLFDIQPDELLRQETISVGSIENNSGALYNIGDINQLSEKLIEQYEARLKEKDELIASLKAKLHDG